MGIMFMFFVIYFIFGWYSYNRSQSLYNDRINQIISKCEEIIEVEDETSSAFVNCKSLLEENEEPREANFFVMLSSIITNNLNALNIILFLIIVAPSIYWINSVLKSKCIKSYYLRESNKDFIKRVLKNSYSYIWIIPLAIICLIVCCSLTSNFSLYDGIENNIPWSLNTISNPLSFIIAYILRIVFYLLFYVNLGLIFSRKHRSFFVSLFTSFLTIVVLQLFYEVVIDKLYGIFKYNWLLYLNFMDIFNIKDFYGLWTSLLFPMILCIISFIIVIILYKNKQRLLLDVETEN